MPRTSVEPGARRARRAASAQPSAVSWSVSAEHVEPGVARPRAPAPPATRVPSLAREWVWRSMRTREPSRAGRPGAHQAGGGPPNGSSTSAGPRPDDVAQDPVVAQQQRPRRPAAAPATASGRRPRRRTPTGRTRRRRRCVETGHSGTGWPSMRTRTGGGPVARSRRRGRRGERRRTRAPSPMPGSSDDHGRRPARRARWSPSRRSSSPARGSPGPPTTPKSVTRQPGAHRPGQVRREAGRGAQVLGERVVRRLGGPPQRRDRAVVGAGPGTGAGLGDRRRAAGAADRAAPVLNASKAGRASGQEFQRSTTGASRSWPSTETVAGVEPEEPAVGHRQPQPARGERPQGVPVPEQPATSAAARGTGRRRGRAARETCSAVSPPGQGCVQTVQPGTVSRISCGGDPLVVAVVPLGQVLVDLGVGEARELGRTTGALAGRWSAPASKSCRPAGRAAPAPRPRPPAVQRQVGRRRVPARCAPLGLAVPDQPDVAHGKRRTQSSASTTTASPAADRVGLRLRRVHDHPELQPRLGQQRRLEPDRGLVAARRAGHDGGPA